MATPSVGGRTITKSFIHQFAINPGKEASKRAS